MFALLAKNFDDVLESVLSLIEETLSKDDSTEKLKRIEKDIASLEKKRNWPICISMINLLKKLMMIKVEAIVREEVFEDVKEALNAIDVNGITVSQVMGCGAQRGYKKRVRGTEVDVMMQPKIKFEIVVSSEEWEKATIDAIQKAAFTGEVGDGKIFSYEIRTATKIRTRESGADALN